MEEAYKMFPDKIEKIKELGKVYYEKNKSKTRRSWDQITENLPSNTEMNPNLDIDRYMQDFKSPLQKPKVDLKSLLAGYAAQPPTYEDGGTAESDTEQDLEAVDKAIDRVNQQQSSGEHTPVHHLDALLGKIDALRMSDSSKNKIENEAINMSGFSDGNKLKELLRKLNTLR